MAPKTNRQINAELNAANDAAMTAQVRKATYAVMVNTYQEDVDRKIGHAADLANRLAADIREIKTSEEGLTASTKAARIARLITWYAVNADVSSLISAAATRDATAAAYDREYPADTAKEVTA